MSRNFMLAIFSSRTLQEFDHGDIFFLKTNIAQIPKKSLLNPNKWVKLIGSTISTNLTKNDLHLSFFLHYVRDGNAKDFFDKRFGPELNLHI